MVKGTPSRAAKIARHAGVGVRVGTVPGEIEVEHHVGVDAEGVPERRAERTGRAGG